MPRNTSLKIARVRADGRTSTALIRGRRVHLVKGGPLGSLQETGDIYPMSQVELLAPIQPGKIVAIGLNYYTHRRPHDPVEAGAVPQGPELADWP